MSRLKTIYVLCVLCVSVATGSGLDREAFTFSRYDLNARIEPEQQRLAVRGTITLRNDSAVAQQSAILQISSSLHWVSIAVDHNPVTFVSQAYTSDIDHTGALTEAIVTLPHAIPPKQSVVIETGYEGVITQDATRLTRIGTPANAAKHSDWDQISAGFAAVRGIGYVSWYPVATEAANLADGSTVPEAVGRWKWREAAASMQIRFSYSGTSAVPPTLYCNDSGKSAKSAAFTRSGQLYFASLECNLKSLGNAVPWFVIANYQALDGPDANISYLPEHKSGADDYVLAVQQVSAWLASWLGDHRSGPDGEIQVIDLPDSADFPFQAGTTLLMPLTGNDTDYLLAAVHQLTSARLPSSRPWVAVGLPLYAQARYVQDQKGAAAGHVYLREHDDVLLDFEKRNATRRAETAGKHSLIDAVDEYYVGAKAIRVWWMLYQMLGDTAFSAALRNYRSDQDTSPGYVQKLMEVQAHRDLSWFFDDWVYNDRGLPEFQVSSVYASQLSNGGYLVTVTVENSGSSAAEVLVTVRFPGGEAADRLIVQAKSKSSIRITAARAPLEAVVNDGTVPERDMSNNTYKIQR